MTEPEWVVWARRLRAIAQTGLAYGESEYDLERYRQIARIADEIFAGHTGADLSQIEDFFAQDSGYATPQVDVRGAVFRDGQVLLVRERLDGLWTLPGGFADVNDSPSKAVEREIFEESGFRARASKLAMVYDKEPARPSSFSAAHLQTLLRL
ncbi:MAG: NUDIX hydrolase N-terminal domain-containing protein [Thermomicrobiales bacterium]